MKHLNFFIFIFILYMYISGVGHMCKTWLQKVHSGWETGGAGGDFKIKNIIKYIGFDLFYFMLEIYCTNVMH